MEFRYAEKFLLGLDFSLIASLRGSDASWLLDIADILNDVRADLQGKTQFVRMHSRLNGLALSTVRSANDDFYYICSQASGITSRILSLGLPVRGAICLGALFDQPFAGIEGPFGPASTACDALIASNALPRIVIDPGVEIAGMDQDIPFDDDGERYLDVLAPGFLKDYWGLHHRYEFNPELPDLDPTRLGELLAQAAKEAAPNNLPSIEWLARFVNRPRRMPI